MATIEFLLTPFIACLLLILINVYFGIHVIKREIIFIDIALAQIAALGSAVAMVVFVSLHPEIAHDHEHHNVFSYLFSLAFITMAALIFTFLKHSKITIPLEAIIGITYAIATTGTVIVLDKGAGGDIHVHDMLIGSILWISWHQVTKLFIIVLLVGLFHLIFRHKFRQISDRSSPDTMTVKNPYLWDFLFYLTFGLVVIEAVNVAGILTIFAFLILPASVSILLSRDWKRRLLTGWGIGLFVVVTGLYLSLKMDVPCSPVIIVLLAAVLTVTLLAYRLSGKKRSKAI
ncbi:MAG: metal ABC transporter permease [Bacteroidales bacterium]|nr:metal ABC transporter permease [Bacteroidales bacterium]